MENSGARVGESWNEGRPADCGEMAACSSSDWHPALFNGQCPGICPLAPPIRADRGKSPGWWWCGSGVPSFTVYTVKPAGSLSTPFGTWARLGELAAWRSTKTDVARLMGESAALQPAPLPTHMVGACDVPRGGHLSVPFPIDFTWIVPDDGLETIEAGVRQEPVLGCFQVVSPLLLRGLSRRGRKERRDREASGEFSCRRGHMTAR